MADAGIPSRAVENLMEAVWCRYRADGCRIEEDVEPRIPWHLSLRLGDNVVARVLVAERPVPKSS
jgi:hypothetical protein